MQHKATKLQKINKNKFEHIYKLTLEKQKKNGWTGINFLKYQNATMCSVYKSVIVISQKIWMMDIIHGLCCINQREENFLKSD